jgi:hypothetical protein
MASPVPALAVAEITETRGVMQSATALIDNFDERLEAARNESLANGATADELAPITTVLEENKAAREALAQAVATHQ